MTHSQAFRNFISLSVNHFQPRAPGAPRSRATVWMKELLARREATGGNGSGAQPRGQERPEPTHSTSQALLPSPGAWNTLAGERDRSRTAGNTKGRRNTMSARRAGHSIRDQGPEPKSSTAISRRVSILPKHIKS